MSGKLLFSIQLFKCLSFHKFCTPNVLPPAQLGQRLYRGRGQCSKTAEMFAVRSRFGRKWQRPKGRSFAIWVIQMEAARAIRCTTWSSCSHRIDLEDWKRHADMPKCHSVSVCTWQKLFGWMGISLPNTNKWNHRDEDDLGAQVRIAHVLSCTVPSLKECLRPKCRNQSTLISNQKEHLRNLMFFCMNK